ncbi:MAG: hypothetical protein WCI73_16455 [Phycisphaerae bacterium]
MPGKLLAGLDRCPGFHQPRNIAHPQTVEVQHGPAGVGIGQEGRFLPLFPGLALYLGNPHLPGRPGVGSQHLRHLGPMWHGEYCRALGLLLQPRRQYRRQIRRDRLPVIPLTLGVGRPHGDTRLIGLQVETLGGQGPQLALAEARGAGQPVEHRPIRSSHAVGFAGLFGVG